MVSHEITIEPVKLQSLRVCKVQKRVNCHIFAHVEGVLADSENAAEVLVRCKNNPLVITLNGQQGAYFQGIIQMVEINDENGLRRITIKAISYTWQMDRVPHIRAFQNTGMTYGRVADIVQSAYNNIGIFPADSGRKTGRLLVQYNETDWQFLKRLASNLSTVIVPHCIYAKAGISVGLPRVQKWELPEPKCYKLLNIGEYFGYELETDEIQELCTPVTLFDSPLLVYSVRAELVNEELRFCYVLMPQRAFEPKLRENRLLAGNAMLGEVTKVRDDKIQISLRCEEDVDGGAQKWYAYSSVYSSPDGSGWYFMPERGDTVRLCFPDAEEDHAFAVSAVHVDDEDELRTDPDVKFIRTAQKKEIRFTPSSITITNNKGISITLDDDEGIVIESDGDIRLMAGQTLTLESGGKLEAVAGGGIMLQQDDNRLVIYNGIKQYGYRVELG